ncbi:hypothetical protein GOEFS_083_00420 [Gordonia effusa NBRC 100432]|uniref:Uncharacterized protein n=1 Tax=Gordonia effusa NBRC 100432 TaxID=1077974 RepID=H0R2V9_9ACTN|nr:hypothetical protein [Gordonia effusa]GAB19410.1 hypothetical protein GOEFS_083_00420 [Gordonia effusa NBRC 100432]
MKHKVVTATLAAATALTVCATPAHAVGSSDIFGSAGSSDFGSSSGKQQHYGKLGRADAPNGVRSINVWVLPGSGVKADDSGVYPKNSQIGVKWNSVIQTGEEVGGNECKMTVKLTGPKVTAKNGTMKSRFCTSRKLFKLKAAGDYSITVTDAVSGASNAIKFTLR